MANLWVGGREREGGRAEKIKLINGTDKLANLIPTRGAEGGRIRNYLEAKIWDKEGLW